MAIPVIRIVGASLVFERRIRSALTRFPTWLIQAARIKHIEASTSAILREVVASYDHSDRTLRVYHNLPDLLLTIALGHELMHAVDDNFDHPHYFTSQDGWLMVHRDQAHFDLPKYRDEPLEYFADVATKYLLLGREQLRITHPRETQFLEDQVFPVLQGAFGGQ